MSQTTNYGFSKPEANTKLTVLINYNGNLDLIDSTIKTVSDAATTASSTATAAQSTATAAQTAADAAQSTAAAAGTAAAAAASAATAAQSTADSKAAIDDTAAAATTTYSSNKIETELDTKQDTITGAATSILDSNLTTNRALISNATGKIEASSVTSTQLGYLSGVTSNIQSQLNNKSNANWTHATSLTLTTTEQLYSNSNLANATEILIIVNLDYVMSKFIVLPYHIYSQQNAHHIAVDDSRGVWNAVNISWQSNSSFKYYRDAATSLSNITIELYYR